jgi:hypothetical protein
MNASNSPAPSVCAAVHTKKTLSLPIRFVNPVVALLSPAGYGYGYGSATAYPYPYPRDPPVKPVRVTHTRAIH